MRSNDLPFRVLVVEDCEFDRAILSRSLRGIEDVEIRFADDGAVGRGMIENYDPQLVILDMSQPCVGCRELIEWMVESKMMRPTLAISGYERHLNELPGWVTILPKAALVESPAVAIAVEHARKDPQAWAWALVRKIQAAARQCEMVTHRKVGGAG